MKKMTTLLAALAMIAMTAGCSNDKPNPSPKPSEQTGENTQQIQLIIQASSFKVTDAQGMAVPNAKVLFGTALNQTGRNFVSTDETGAVAIPEGFDAASSPITVEAEGYVRKTVYGRFAQTGIITLSPKKQTGKLELNGLVTKLPIQNGDGNMDFGIVMPALTKADLLAFDLNNVLSPYSDKITVAGNSLYIPTNVSIPTQKESYIIPITLSKPTYRMYFNQPGSRRIVAIKGRFQFKPVVDEFRRGKQFFELINYFNLSGASSRDVEIVNATTQLDVPADELKFSQKLTFTPPTAQKDEVVIAVAASEYDGYMLPTDIKRLENSKPLALNLLPDTKPFLVTVLKKAADFASNGLQATRMSANLANFDANIKPTLLPLIDAPKISEQGKKLALPMLKPTADVDAFATVLTLSTVTVVKEKEDVVETTSPQWEVYADAWMTEFTAPEWPSDGKFEGKKRWTVNFIGKSKTYLILNENSITEEATHVTNSSADFN